jgi:hypothetical protein
MGTIFALFCSMVVGALAFVFVTGLFTFIPGAAISFMVRMDWTNASSWQEEASKAIYDTAVKAGIAFFVLSSLATFLSLAF